MEIERPNNENATLPLRGASEPASDHPALADATPPPDKGATEPGAHGERQKRWRVFVGRGLCLIGIVGMAFAVHLMPDNHDLVFVTAKWAGLAIMSSIVGFAGLPGMFTGSINTHHLRIIDLIWVLASAVAVFLRLCRHRNSQPHQ